MHKFKLLLKIYDIKSFMCYNINMKDLHIHTKYSDGEYDEYQILEEVQKAGVTEFAICDHDTIDGSKRVKEVLKNQQINLKFHTGIELTCTYKEFDRGVNMHILVYDFEYNDKNMLAVIDKISYLRRQKVDKMVKYVENVYNIKIPTEKLEEKLKSTKSFGKPHIYSIMQEIGDFDREEYYRNMDKLSTEEFKLSTKDTISKLKNSGKLVLAHPIEIMKEYNYDMSAIEKLLISLKSLGLHGVESYHSSQTKQLQKELSLFAKKYGLIETMGSDFHGPNVKPNLNIGEIQKN